jgi:hypothetical protein
MVGEVGRSGPITLQPRNPSAHRRKSHHCGSSLKALRRDGEFKLDPKNSLSNRGIDKVVINTNDELRDATNYLAHLI